MPATYAHPVLALELVLFLVGCVLLWRLGLSPAARRQPLALPCWNIKLSDFFMFLWLVVCCGLLMQFAAVPLLRHAALGASATTILTGAAFHVGMLGGVIIFGRLHRAGAALPTARAAAQILGGCAVFLIALPLITACGLLWQELLSAVGLPAEPQDLIALFASIKSPLLLAVMIFLAVVMAPVTEELVFRAGLFRYARSRLPRWLALALPACLFASLHANLASFAPLTLLGVIFSLAYERTGSIAVPIVAHGLFNLNTIVLILAGIGL
jgi:membrane protease YdiL (CAAX protease family)